MSWPKNNTTTNNEDKDEDNFHFSSHTWSMAHSYLITEISLSTYPNTSNPKTC